MGTTNNRARISSPAKRGRRSGPIRHTRAEGSMPVAILKLYVLSCRCLSEVSACRHYPRDAARGLLSSAFSLYLSSILYPLLCMPVPVELTNRLRSLIDPDRLVRTVVELVKIPSWTGDAGAVLNRLGEMLTSEGFRVERPPAGHARAPAVAVRLQSAKRGRTLQFNGHLDTVHLPFVAPQVRGDRITGSGSCDMKGGTAAAVEALRVLRDSGALTAGSVLLTAHDLHEAPWGDGR